MIDPSKIEKENKTLRMYVVSNGSKPKACCYNERDAKALVSLIENDAVYCEVPIVVFRNERESTQRNSY